MVVMTIVLLVGSMIMPSAAPSYAKQGTNDAKDIINNLTAEQQAALKQLDADVGFTVHPSINQESDDLVELIVEFKQDPAAVEVAKAKLKKERNVPSLKGAKQKVEASHTAFKNAIKQLDDQQVSRLAKHNKTVSIEITQEYRDAFNGVAITMPGTAIKDIMQTGLVKRIWKNETVQLDFPKEQGKAITPKMIDSVPQIGVDRLHEEGIFGEGIKVGVIDTGIDYNHPDLTDAYQGYRAEEGEDAAAIEPNSVKGWDFVENDADPMETTYEQWLESDAEEFDAYGNSFYTSHGTHVSGTVAGQQGNDVDYAVKGVAPGVELYSYRVLGPYGSGDTNWVLGGIDKAVADGMDVINLSLGMNTNDALSPTAIAVNNAMLSGVVAVVAAGNAGPSAQTVGAPGTAAFAISVGASDAAQTIPVFTATTGETAYADVQLLAKNFSDKLEGLKGQSYPLEYVGYGDGDDYIGKDLTGKIALVERGELSFNDKLIHAYNAGTEAVIVFNNEAGQIPYYVGESTSFPKSFRVSKEDGEKLVEAAKENTPFTFGELSDTQSEGDYLADFSSRGPVAGSYDIKPDVVAPGVAIFSTYPAFVNDPTNQSYDNAYARIQGTSMAAPHVAGSAALILQEHPEYTPFQVKAALMNTAVDLKEDYSVYEAGAGRINVYDAVYAETAITAVDTVKMVEENNEIIKMDHETGSIRFGSFYINEGESIESTKKLTIANQTSEEKSYTIEVDFLQANEGNRKDAEANGVVLNIPDTITVSGGEKVEVDAEMTVPDHAAHGFYEGYLRILDDAGESYQVPFAIRISSKGFDYLELDRPAVPNRWSYHPFLIPFLSMKVNLKSPMDLVYIVIKDPKTSEPIGIVGALKDLEPDTEYVVSKAFLGNAQRFTGDPEQPIEEKLTRLPEGDYIFELLGIDESGEEFTIDTDVIVDNTPPELTFLDYEPGIIEVNESMFTEEHGQEAFWIHTNVYDDTIDVLNEKGYEYDQSSNFVTFYQNNLFPNALGVAPDGKMSLGVLPEELEAGPVEVDLQPVDLATNADTRAFTRYTFVKEGSSYGVQRYDKEKIYLNDSFTMTLQLKDVEALLSGTFDVEFDKTLFTLEDVQVNEAFQRYADENGIQVKLDEPVIDETDWFDMLHVGASLEGNDDFKGFTGDSAFLDVTFKLTSDEYFDGATALGIETFSYEQLGGTEPVDIPIFLEQAMEVIPKHSILSGFIGAEAFIHDDGFLEIMDYENAGFKVYAEASNGKKYTAEVNEYGEYLLYGMPASEKEFTIYFELPGHINTQTTVQPGYDYKDEFIGEEFWVDLVPSPAGDVNGDGVIDIHDVMRVVAQYGKDHPNTDINLDGIVDETDIRYIEKNFLKVGEGVKKAPMEKLGPKGLNDFLKAVGLEPME